MKTLIPEEHIQQIRDLLAKTSQKDFELGRTEHPSLEAAVEAQRSRLSFSESLVEWSVVFKDPEVADAHVFVCLTGNGPTSEANANFFGMSKRIIQALLEERDGLLQEINELHLK